MNIAAYEEPIIAHISLKVRHMGSDDIPYVNEACVPISGYRTCFTRPVLLRYRQNEGSGKGECRRHLNISFVSGVLTRQRCSPKKSSSHAIQTIPFCILGISLNPIAPNISLSRACNPSCNKKNLRW